MAIQLAYPIPMPAIMTQSYAEHVERARANGWVNYNGGIDWAVPQGTPVTAAAAGRVTVARHDATGYGMHVRIQHDGGYLTIYAHLSALMVRVGDSVQVGQLIGKSGNTGNSTGPHLHFELRQNGKPVDPEPYLQIVTTPDTSVTTPAADYQAGDIVTTIAQYNVRTGPEITNNRLGLSDIGVTFVVSAVSGDWLQTVVYIHRDGVRRG